jgi:prolipoprotein diacylglyceryltransferase
MPCAARRQSVKNDPWDGTARAVGLFAAARSGGLSFHGGAVAIHDYRAFAAH